MLGAFFGAEAEEKASKDAKAAKAATDPAATASR